MSPGIFAVRASNCLLSQLWPGNRGCSECGSLPFRPGNVNAELDFVTVHIKTALAGITTRAVGVRRVEQAFRPAKDSP
jgi:hypothetical protein